ncbi:MAG: 30S ribosomal protein S11 [Coxiellaceae bacterium]|nr:30S ribosomal protein S11 [Coxiellaceae bacterium]
MAKKREIVTEGVAHIKATFNNTLVTITTLSGDALCSCSSGECGFKGARKGTPFAAQQAAEKAAAKAKEMFQMKRAAVMIKGAGPGRDSAMRGVSSVLTVTKLVDTTTVTHNGCRPKKKRRV